MDLKETYNVIAQDWAQEHRSDVWGNDGMDTFVSLLKSGDTVLDAGCGPGFRARMFAEKGLRVTGIDFSEEMIAQAKKEAPQGSFAVMDVRDIAELDKQFDGIYARALLLHIPKKEISDIVHTLFSVLKSGGYLYVSVKEKRDGQSEEEMKEEDDYGYAYERFFSYFTLDEMKEYLMSYGTRICYEKISPIGKTNWIQLICRKG